MSSICFIAGDPSGDFHAARLIETLTRHQPSLVCTALGGTAMQKAGAELLDELTTAASIGPFDAARHLGHFIRAKRLLENHLKVKRPDLVILVDFGDFNLPIIAPLVSRYGIPILYYISPQVWAWGRWRLRYIRRYVQRMIVFFPFEEAFYKREGIPVSWVGHPLVESSGSSLSPQEAMRRFDLNPWRMTVGLLPGSRVREVHRHLPLMLGAAKQIVWHMPGIQFLLPRAAGISREMLESAFRRFDVPVRLAEGPIADSLALMQAALVASGTATLEVAWHEVPMVVVYKTSWLTYLAARMVLRVPHIAMVNLVAGRRVVPELIQHHAQPKRIARELVELLRDEERLKTMQGDLRFVKSRLGSKGVLDRAAALILEQLPR